MSGTAVVTFSEEDGSIDAKTADNSNNDTKPFWIEIGTNLDLVDGPKLNNFTAGIFFHKFDHKWGNGASNRWTSFAGAYEAKIVSTDNDLRFGVDSMVGANSFIPGRRDTIMVFNYGGKPKQTQTVRNWSFFYSPAYRWGKGAYNDGNFHIYSSLWFELRYQEVRTTIDNSSLTLIDTSRVPVNSISNYKQTGDTVTRSSAFAHYVGIGMPIVIESANDKGFSFLLNPVIGYSNQLSSEDYAILADKKLNGLVNKGSKWHPFYFVQFRLSDKEFGITVTGELRGLMIRNNPPQYTIALTKKFNLQKLIYFNNGK